MTIAANIHQVQEHIASACARAGRDPRDVTLLAVSKTHPPAVILEAAAHLQHFGENRVEEAVTKIPAVMQQTDQPLVWHMVGHIQSRKARDVVALFSVVHSLDSVKLADRLSRLAVERDKTLDVLLEVNVSGEDAKYGFNGVNWSGDPAVREPLEQAVAHIAALPGLRLRGLMTMAPIVSDMEQTRPVFAALAGLRDALRQSLGLDLPDLSMGMTDDYPVAIEEGATIVRVGRAIFGARRTL